MTGDASDAVTQVHRTEKIHILQAGFMALKAALAGFFRRQFCEANDLCLVATAFNVS